MSYTTDYCKIVDKHGMNQAPSILMALHKLDENKDLTKRKGLFEAVATAITKWDAAWTAGLKEVADQKDKLARSQFAVEIRKMKQALQAESTKKPLPPIPAKADPNKRPLPPIPAKADPNKRPLPPIPAKADPNKRPLPPIPTAKVGPNKKTPPPPPNKRPLPPIPSAKAKPYKKTTFGSDFQKARAGVPFGAAAVALWNLDNAATLAEAKPLALAAQKALEKEASELDAELKGIKDEDRKLKVAVYRLFVRQLLAKVKAAAK